VRGEGKIRQNLLLALRKFVCRIRRYDGCLCSLCRKITGLQNLRSIEELNLRRNRIRNHAAIFNLAYSIIMICWYRNKQKVRSFFWANFSSNCRSFCSVGHACMHGSNPWNCWRTKAKCRHPEKFTCKRTLRQVFTCLRLPAAKSLYRAFFR
jgi:hypothetical protein